MKKTNPGELEKRIQELESSEYRLKQSQSINKALFTISNAVNHTLDLEDLYPSIRNSLKPILDVTNFFIAIVDQESRTLYFPYHVDTMDDDFLPIANFNVDNSLTGMVVEQKKPVLIRGQALKKRDTAHGVWGPTPLIWLGVPLIIKAKVIGVMAVQSYEDENCYSNQDLQVLSAVSDQVAIAIDRKRAETQVLASEKRFRLILEEMAGISVQGYDESRQVTFWNTASEKLYGFSRSQAMGKKIEDLIIPSRQKEEIKQLHRRWIDQGEKIPEGEVSRVDKDGKDVPVFSSHVMYKTSLGKEMFCIDVDLAPLKEAENEKIKAQKIAGEQKKLALVGQVAGKMAHDFNNILGIIMGNAELSMLHCKDDRIRKTLELIFNQTLQGRSLTKNLVAFAKDQEPRQTFFNLGSTIQLAVDLLKKDLEGIRVIQTHSPGIPDLLADPGMMEHVLVNLLQNAIHAVSQTQSPCIKISSFASDTHICLDIMDNGCGIPKDQIERIYDPAFTLKGSRDLKGAYQPGIKGTGYGMANVKKYIEQHRGTIILSTEEGKGTGFSIHLPITRKELTSEEIQTIDRKNPAKGKHILVVEDEPAISSVQKAILSQAPCRHQVDIAESGQEAIDLISEHAFDLVSLDYLLPGHISGMDVYHHIRKKDPQVPVMFVSGNIEFLESIKGLKEKDPNMDHLSKPCRNTDYMILVNTMLQGNQ